MTKFKKGELTKDSLRVILFDLEALTLKDTKDNKYHKRLLIGNLKDIWGLKR